MPRMYVVLLLASAALPRALHYPLNLAAAAALLDLRLPSPRAAVKSAYRKKASVAHPDIASSDASTDAFVQITAAYEMMLQFGTCPSPVVAHHHEPKPAADQSSSHAQPPWTPRSSTSQPFTRDPERMVRRIQAWRVYWQHTFMAAQAASEAEVKSAACDEAEREVSARRAELHAALASGRRGADVDSFRARYVGATATLADARCAFGAFTARARALRQQALAKQVLAQQVV